MASLVFGPEGSAAYVSLLDRLEPQTVHAADAREFAGAADLWVHAGALFVTNPEALTITKYRVSGGELVEEGVLSLAAYGLTDLGFWLNSFVAPDKAYVLNGAAELVIWNPERMEITGALALPEVAVPEGFQLFPGYSDRAARLRGGRLYQPLYTTDESYFSYTPETSIAVIDVATDSVVSVLEAPCPGLDYATADAAGDLYFSSWVYAAGGAAILDQPATCVARVLADDTVERAFAFEDVAEGRQGAALRILSGDRALISVLHDERATEAEAGDAAAFTFGANWRFWSHDMASGASTMIDAIDWNAGGQYTFDIDGKHYTAVPAGDYTATTVYELTEGGAVPVFESDGWVVRLFAL